MLFIHDEERKEKQTEKKKKPFALFFKFQTSDELKNLIFHTSELFL